LEDESDYLQVAFYDRSIDRCMATVLLSPVIVVRGVIKRQGLGASLEAQQAAPLNVGELLQEDRSAANPSPALKGGKDGSAKSPPPSVSMNVGRQGKVTSGPKPASR